MDERLKDSFRITNHVIALGLGYDDLVSMADSLEMRVEEVNIKAPMEVLRVVLHEYVLKADFNTILLVDVGLSTEKKMSAFLKLLENDRFYGHIWFWGAPLEFYPLTIISRCNRIASYPDIAVGDKRHLQHYSIDVVEAILQHKQNFISFLLGLQNMSHKDYHLLSSYNTNNFVFKHLFIEWLANNEIFSKKELEYCPKLREHSFLKLFRQLQADFDLEKYVIPYLIAYQATK